MKILAYIIVVSLLFFACGKTVVNYNSDTKKIDQTIVDNAIDTLILPFRKELNQNMNQIIGYADSNLLSFAPESPLSNLIADLVFDYGYEYLLSNNFKVQKEQCFGILNFGGIRRPLNQGSINKGIIYELMPFDNSIVIVEIHADKMHEILKYLNDNNGQPISNIYVELSTENSNFKIANSDQKFDSYFVVTSDYLSGGGDNMRFFLEPLNLISTNRLLREEIISFIEKTDTLKYQPIENRIVYTE